MTEIGGYFGLEEFLGREYYPKLIAVNYARNAIVALLKEKGCSKVWLPYYLCDEVQKACCRAGINVMYYHVTSRLLPLFPSEIKPEDGVLLVNYFGRLSEQEIREYAQPYKNVVVDNTQAFFAEPLPSIDTVYTCRKFFGVPDGAYISTKISFQNIQGEQTAMKQMEYLVGRYEGGAEAYYKAYQQAEKHIAHTQLAKMSRISHNILRVLNYEEIAKRRWENYNHLKISLDELNQNCLPCHSAPFAYPFVTNKASYLREQLREQAVFVPTLWPNVLELDPAKSSERAIAEKILPLPCDHRYATEQMEKMISIIRKNMEEDSV